MLISATFASYQCGAAYVQSPTANTIYRQGQITGSAGETGAATALEPYGAQSPRRLPLLPSGGRLKTSLTDAGCWFSG